MPMSGLNKGWAQNAYRSTLANRTQIGFCSLMTKCFENNRQSLIEMCTRIA